MSTSNISSLSRKKALKKTFEDITAEKTARIKHLKRLVQDAKKELAEAEASYSSFESKAELFSELLGEANNKLTTLTSQDDLSVDSSQKVKSLYHLATNAMSTANDTYADAQELLRNVQKVVTATLSATTEITLAAERIMTRKASNPLISSQLVADATQAASDANKAVTLIVNTLTSAFNALSTANQASNTSEVVQSEVIYLKDLVVSVSQQGADQSGSLVPTVEDSVKNIYMEARALEKESQLASDEANQQMIKAKNELIRATADLANTEAALNAAEAAVGS